MDRVQQLEKIQQECKKIFEKKKSYLTIIQAVVSPNNKEQKPTPNNKVIVLIMYIFNFVDKRGFQL